MAEKTFITGPNGEMAGVTKSREAYNGNGVNVVAPTGIHRASLQGDAYVINMRDAAPAAAEYPLYFSNEDSARDFVVSSIESYGTDADVEWILTTVTGTAAGAAVITPENLNLGKGREADAICRGGAGGVTGLTPVTTIKQWFNGVANTTEYIDLKDSLILTNGSAIAIEYQAGTGGAAILCVRGYYIDVL